MIMKKILVLLFIIFSLFWGEGLGGFSFAQQVGMYTHYFYKPMVNNPAFTGYESTTNAMLLHRNQWADFKGAPRLTVFTMDGSLIDKKVGLGFSLSSDRKGITNRTIGNVSYSYGINIGEDARVLFGVSFGVIYQTLDFSKTLVENNTDPNLFSDLQRKTALDGNAGIAFIWKGLEFGAAVPQLMQNKINYVDYANVRGYYALARHYMASLKYKFVIIEDKGISLVPQGLVRFVPGAPLQYDATLMADWKDKCWLGATYKSNYAVAVNVGFSVHKQLSIGYSYDIIVGSIGNYSGMSHELMLNFKFPGNRKKDLRDSLPSNQFQNKNYEELITALQTDVDETDKSIKDLEARINKRSKDKKSVPEKTLTDLVVQNLAKKIEEMFDNPTATSEEIQGLRDEISAFLDSDFADNSTRSMLKKQYESLNRSQNVTSVLVKGVVAFPKTLMENNFSSVNISVTDIETGNLVGTYIPNAKTGKYLFILTPGRKYTIAAEATGYENYSEEFAPVDSRESYEISHQIRLKEK